jgi:hypothetical protein
LQNDVQSVLPGGTNYPNDYAPILTAIETCHLPAVSWVIPDGNWSDHANKGAPGDAGPSWVEYIVNAVGISQCEDNHVTYWNDTVILITWDDWGGWYDDVVPPGCGGPGQCTGYPNHTGGQYVYGFRVPLLAVSAYSVQSCSGSGCNGYTGNVSNVNHDFGSILSFIEYAFGTGGNFLGGPTACGIGSCNYPYADFFAPDVSPIGPDLYGLEDFFTYSNTLTKISFQQINGAAYSENCFHHPHTCFLFYPDDPDNDAYE